MSKLQIELEIAKFDVNDIITISNGGTKVEKGGDLVIPGAASDLASYN